MPSQSSDRPTWFFEVCPSSQLLLRLSNALLCGSSFGFSPAIDRCMYWLSRTSLPNHLYAWSFVYRFVLSIKTSAVLPPLQSLFVFAKGSPQHITVITHFYPYRQRLRSLMKRCFLFEHTGLSVAPGHNELKISCESLDAHVFGSSVVPTSIQHYINRAHKQGPDLRFIFIWFSFRRPSSHKNQNE